jgi:hypothetical protein
VTLPQIDATDDRVGFRWLSSEGSVLPLREVIALPGAEPDRWLPTHLEALDDVLIEVAGTYGDVLGGGRRPTTIERDALVEVYSTLDRLCWEYADAHATTAFPGTVRAGQIIGTAALMSIRAREATSMMGAPPFEGELDEPGLGVIGGRAGLHWVSPEAAWLGARWLVVTDDGLRLPATLSMLLFDASGVDKDATLTEHREALTQVTGAMTDPTVEPMQASGALDWLLFDWIMAHRDGPDSGAVEIRSGKVADADMIVAATAASARIRARFDPALVGSLA